MSEKTLTRMDLSEAVFREVGLSRNESADLVENVLNHVSDALVRGRTSESYRPLGHSACAIKMRVWVAIRKLAKRPLSRPDAS